MFDAIESLRVEGQILLVIYLLFVALWIVGVVLTVWMLVDCMRRDAERFRGLFFEDGRKERVAWVAILLFTFVWWVGGLLYFFFVYWGNPGRKKRIPQSRVRFRREFPRRGRKTDAEEENHTKARRHEEDGPNSSSHSSE